MTGGLVVLALGSSVAMADKITSGGGSGSGGGVVDVLAALIGKAVNADSYTATTATGPAFTSANNLVNAIQLGTGPRATIGACNTGGICFGPNDGAIGTMVFISGSLVSKSAQVQGPLDMLGVDAYLINNNGSDPVRVEDVDGFRINGTTPLKGRVAVSVTFDAPAINNNSCTPSTVSAPGARPGDFVSANADFFMGDDLFVGGVRVTANDSVELTICNVNTSVTTDPPSGTFLIKMER
jgi:hypothetical protein